MNASRFKILLGGAVMGKEALMELDEFYKR